MQDLPDIDAVWNYSQPDVSETRFRELLAAHPDAPPLWRHVVLTQVARALGLQRRFEDGHAVLDELDPTLGDALPRARAALERGRLYNSAGEPDAARPWFEQALEIAECAELDYYAVDAVHMLAIVASGAEARELNEEAVARAERSTDERARGWLGSLYNNLGWAYHDDDLFEDALAWFERALEFRRAAGTEPGLRIALWTVARTWRSLHRYEEALAAQRDILETYGEDIVSGYVFEEIAECLLALSRADEARPWFARAHERLSMDPWMIANEAPRLSRLQKLGR